MYFPYLLSWKTLIKDWVTALGIPDSDPGALQLCISITGRTGVMKVMPVFVAENGTGF